ncbi:MAG TPA: hypothetical protein DCX95_04940 [Elusimicrobia bacterium]|nr:hypothetical protein [Elusimicrobiota bacterium]
MQNDFGQDKEIKFFELLSAKKVRYLLIGRQACIIYGLPVNTFDYDIAVDNTSENLMKVLEIAKDLDLKPSKSKDDILNKRVALFNLQNDIKIDVFCAKRYGTTNNKFVVFSEAFERRKIVKDKKYGLVFYVPAIDDLIMFKKINPREKDFEDIKMLESIKGKKK